MNLQHWLYQRKWQSDISAIQMLVGKTVKIDKEDFTVTGVFEKYPGHFHRD
jgi:hypothetical protein